jgi:hypothetical protein
VGAGLAGAVVKPLAPSAPGGPLPALAGAGAAGFTGSTAGMALRVMVWILLWASCLRALVATVGLWAAGTLDAGTTLLVAVLAPAWLFVLAPTWFAWRVLGRLRTLPAVMAACWLSPLVSARDLASLRVFLGIAADGSFPPREQVPADAWTALAAALQAERQHSVARAERIRDALAHLPAGSRFPWLARVHGVEALVLAAIERGDWAAASRYAGLGRGRLVALLAVLARGQAGEAVPPLALWGRWALAPLRLRTYGWVRAALRRQALPASVTPAPTAPAMAERRAGGASVAADPRLGHVLLVGAAARGQRLSMHEVFALAAAWESRLDEAALAAVHARALELDLRDGVEHARALREGVLDELAQLAASAEGPLPALRPDSSLAAALAGRARERLLQKVQSAQASLGAGRPLPAPPPARGLGGLADPARGDRPRRAAGGPRGADDAVARRRARRGLELRVRPLRPARRACGLGRPRDVRLAGGSRRVPRRSPHRGDQPRERTRRAPRCLLAARREFWTSIRPMLARARLLIPLLPLLPLLTLACGSGSSPAVDGGELDDAAVTKEAGGDATPAPPAAACELASVPSMLTGLPAQDVAGTAVLPRDPAASSLMSSLAMDSARIYFFDMVEGSMPSAGRVVFDLFRVPIVGGPKAQLTNLGDVNPSGTYRPPRGRRLRVLRPVAHDRDGDERAQVLRVSVGGGDPEAVAAPAPPLFVLDADNLYWARVADGHWSVGRTGLRTRMSATVFMADEEISDLVIDEGHVYWTTKSGVLYSLGKTADAPVALGSAPGGSLRASGGFAYWLGDASAAGGIVRIRSDGQCRQQLVAGASVAGGFDVAGDRLVWVAHRKMPSAQGMGPKETHIVALSLATGATTTVLASRTQSVGAVVTNGKSAVWEWDARLYQAQVH